MIIKSGNVSLYLLFPQKSIAGNIKICLRWISSLFKLFISQAGKLGEVKPALKQLPADKQC